MKVLPVLVFALAVGSISADPIPVEIGGYNFLKSIVALLPIQVSAALNVINIKEVRDLISIDHIYDILNRLITSSTNPYTINELPCAVIAFVKGIRASLDTITTTATTDQLYALLGVTSIVLQTTRSVLFYIAPNNDLLKTLDKPIDGITNIILQTKGLTVDELKKLAIPIIDDFIKTLEGSFSCV